MGMDVALKPYTLGVNSSKLNRATIILSAVGFFIAAVLSLQHIWHKEIPCGGSNDCTAVAAHPSSYFMGVPVAFFGAAGYLALLAIGMIRALTGKTDSSQFVLPGYIMSIIGFFTSWYLQYVAYFQVRATCKWCVGSAIVMTIIFAVYSKYYSVAGRSSAGEDEAAASPVKTDLVIGTVGLLAASLFAFGIVQNGNKVSMMIEEVDSKAASSLVATPGNILGDESAKVTLVEFADLCCPTCRKGFPKLQGLKTKFGDKIRIVYRHFPLFRIPGHEMTTIASVASEVAAERGKFWAFAAAYTSVEDVQKTPEEVFAAAESVGIDKALIEKAINDENSPAMQRMLRDYKAGLEVFKVGGTPTFFLSYNGKTKKLNGEALNAELSSPEVQALLK